MISVHMRVLLFCLRTGMSCAVPEPLHRGKAADIIVWVLATEYPGYPGSGGRIEMKREIPGRFLPIFRRTFRYWLPGNRRSGIAEMLITCGRR